MYTTRRTLALLGYTIFSAASFLAALADADEIRLKDGKKLYGVIVAYEDNMFKVKTDYGYVLVEKDKIASIIPDTPSDKAGAKPAASSKPKDQPAAKASAPSDEVTPAVANEAPKQPKPVVVSNSTVRPELPIPATSHDVAPPAIKTVSATPKSSLAAGSAAPPPPKEEGPREEIQGNLYMNHEFGFRMYKAPSWQIIEGAGQTLPNAIVAMGTSNESTLLVIGHEEKGKAALDSSAKAVETKLHEVYDNYRLISERKTNLAGLPAVEYRYRGLADGHDWSGTLAVVGRNGEIFTVLGMTYADTDLIQIQENVISRAIASIDFNAK